MNMADPLSIRLVLPEGASSIIEVNLNSHPISRQIARHGQIGDAPSCGNLGSCSDPDGIEVRSPFSQCRAVFWMSIDPFEVPATDEFERHADLAFGGRHSEPVAVPGPPVLNPGVVLLSFDPEIGAVGRVIYPEWFDIRADRS